MQTTRLRPTAGIALGPILFVLAILALIAGVMSAGSGGFSVAGVADRVSADVSTQANLIRAKISECSTMYGTNNNYDGFPRDSTGGSPGILVSAVECAGDPTGLQNLWSGNRATTLPPPTTGFGSWYYVNTNPNSLATGLSGTATGGRCIYIQPNSASGGISAGLVNAQKKFTHSTANDGVSEVNFDPASTHLRFVVWISTPPTPGAENANCKPQ